MGACYPRTVVGEVLLPKGGGSCFFYPPTDGDWWAAIKSRRWLVGGTGTTATVILDHGDWLATVALRVD